ncbi:MAG: restriction endonuclease subunit S [Pseudomonadales bacterium]
MTEQKNAIPESWGQANLEDICDILDSFRIPVNNSERSKRIAGKLPDKLYPYYGATGQVGVIDDYIFEGEHILLGEDGAPFLDPFKNKAYLVSGKFWVNNHAHILKAAVSNKYLCYYLNQIGYSDHVTGTTRLKLNQTALRKIPVRVAPTNEQHRIVAKIETLFSELDKGIESLKTAREQLKVYRQAVLKHAFEGKLTAQWREENKDKLESPEQLLARIQQERQDRYQKQLQDWQTAVKAWEKNGKEGRKPGKPRGPDLSSPLTDREISDRYELPDSWAWKTIGELFGVFVGSTPSRKKQDYWGGHIPWVSSGEVAFCSIKETREKITKIGYENTSTDLHPVGTVMLAMIGEGKTRGQAAILHIQSAHNQNTAAVRVSESGCMPEYIYYFFLYQYEMTRRLGSGNNQKALNKQRVSMMAVPLCSTFEQSAVVEEIELKLSVIEKNEQEINHALHQSEVLRQSILKKAFSGELVSQDHSDGTTRKLISHKNVRAVL